MAGLVLGINVSPAKGAGATTEAPARRKLRVFVNERRHVFGEKPGFSFVLQEGAMEPTRDSVLVPSSMR